MSTIGSPLETSLLQSAQAQQSASKARDKEKAATDRRARYQDMVDLRVAGVEAAFSAGPVLVQSELIGSWVNRRGQSNPFFWSAYGQASWFITGESRSYKGGKFGRTKATNAWELAARFSNMDLEDGNVLGGEQDIITVGLNYYVNPYLRFMFNYVKADADDASGRFVDDNGNRINDEPGAFVVRAAMDFK